MQTNSSRVAIGTFMFSIILLTPLEAQQYVISTYAGGAPRPPASAVSMATDAAGNVYFVDGDTYYPNPFASNCVFKLDPSGTITRVAGNSRTGFSGDGGPAVSASLTSPRGVAADNAGNVFIVDAGNQRVRRVSPDGIITTTAGGGSAVLGDGGPATSGQLNYPGSIAIDGAGNLFIGELGRVRKVSTDGIITTVAGGGPNTADNVPATSVQLDYIRAVAVDGTGNLFITYYVTSNGQISTLIRKISANGTITTVSGPDGSNIPFSGNLAADWAGNLFIPALNTILKIAPDGNQTIVAGNGGLGPSSGDGGAASKASLNAPMTVAVDSAGDLFIGDNAGRSIRKVSADGVVRTVSTLSSIRGATPAPPSGDGGPAISAQLQLAVPGLSNQSGLAVDGGGNLYIAETGAHRIRKVSPDGIITTVAGVGAPACSGPNYTCLPLGDGGPATAATLWYPTGVAVDGNGNLLIADAENHRVRKVSPDGTITTLAGNGTVYASPDGTPAVTPVNIAVDGDGNVFVSGFGPTQKISPDGKITDVTIPAGGFAIDHTGNLFFFDSDCNDEYCDNYLRKLLPDGTVSTIAGVPAGAGDPGDGIPARTAQLGYVSAIAVDAAGDIFLTDQLKRRIRMIDTNGIITTIAGSGADGYSGDDGPAIKAATSYPFALAVDSAGNIYLSDGFNQAVRVLRPPAQ